MALINVYHFFRLCCSLQHTEPRSPPAALSTALASFSLCSFNRPAKSGPDMSICKNISQVDNNIWRYICKSLQSHRTFLRRFLSTQHHIFIDYGLSARDGQHSALFVSALASQQVFWYLSVFPLICRISWWARRGERTSCTLVQLHWSGLELALEQMCRRNRWYAAPYVCPSTRFHCSCLRLSNWLVMMIDSRMVRKVIITKWDATWKDSLIGFCLTKPRRHGKAIC